MQDFTIHVEVNLGEATLNVLQNLLQNRPSTDTVKTVTAARAQQLETKAETTGPAPAEPADDLPGPITDEELRMAVKNAKDATSAADVKTIFAEFGIKTSSECPDAKRRDLLSRLVKLANAA